MRPLPPTELSDAALAELAVAALDAAAARPGLTTRIVADVSLDAKVALRCAQIATSTRATPRTARMRAAGPAPRGDAA